MNESKVLSTKAIFYAKLGALLPLVFAGSPSLWATAYTSLLSHDEHSISYFWLVIGMLFVVGTQAFSSREVLGGVWGIGYSIFSLLLSCAIIFSYSAVLMRFDDGSGEQNSWVLPLFWWTLLAAPLIHAGVCYLALTLTIKTLGAGYLIAEPDNPPLAVK
ncbi:MAG: hypothetical protein ACRCSF_01280 [Mycobacteriaceae bacterium]